MQTLSLSIFLLVANVALAQLAPACAGGSPATSCATACINCNFNGYVGSTIGFPSGSAPEFCGTVENAQWLGFIAGADMATFTVMPSDCWDGNGLQIALYEDCMKAPLACAKGQERGGLMPVSISHALVPGRNYFLLIDGFAGDQCDFRVSVSPEKAVYEPPLGTVGQISGPAKLCPGGTGTYTVPPVYGAGAYIWSGPPGAKIDTFTLPVTLVGAGANEARITLGEEGGQICVQAANSCKSTPPCSASLTVGLLDASFKPELKADTVQYLTCSGEATLLKVAAPNSEGILFEWAADSSGAVEAGDRTLQASVRLAGLYTIKALNPKNGCQNELSIHVPGPDTPRWSDLRLRHSTCFGTDDGQIQIAGIKGGRPPYLYAFDGGSLGDIVVFGGLKPRQYPLSVESSDGCRSDTVVTLTEPVEFIMELGPDTILHLGEQLPLWSPAMLNDPQRAAKVETRPAALQAMLCDTCRYLPPHSFRYVVTATDAKGCTATDERMVTVGKERRLFAPNIFRPDPNADANAWFRLSCGEDVERIHYLRVFSRWGTVLYEQTDNMPQDDASGWDGRVDGQLAPPSVYVWQASVRFKDGETETFNGTVTLVR